MKRLLLLLLFVPAIAFAQKKKKKQKMADEKANTELVARLTTHVQYLASDALQGRRTGTEGEMQAANYIINQYKQMGLQPQGTQGYLQPFEINEGKQPDASFLLGGKKLELFKEFIPLAFSATKFIKGEPAIAFHEKGQPWFLDLKPTLEDNRSNPHFDVEDFIKKQADIVASKGAAALLLYNSSTLIDNIQFNKNDKSEALKIPVVYFTKDIYSKYLTDPSSIQQIECNIAFKENIRTAHNIVGFIDNKAANTIILGAHYDHLGFGEDKNALDTGHIIHNGADDNASGTAALIELTKKLLQSSPKNNNYLIIHFSGEELGLFGSKYWLEHPTTNITPNYMINMDMVGRYDTTHKLVIGGYGTSPTWGQVLPTLTTNLITKYDSSGSGPSDHASFYRANIPVLFFFTGSHPDYHKATDDWEKVNYQGEKDIVQYITNIIAATDASGKLTFAKTTEPKMGKASFSVSLGVIPDYGFSGTGVRIDGVSPGKLAERTGLQAGDILLQLGEYKFVDVMSYMTTLGKFKKGDKTKLTIKRKDEEKEFEIEF
jgi:aminopeptidase YwaD